MNRHTARPRWLMPWLARLGLAAFASWWLALFGSSGFSPSVFLLFAMLPLTVASLFLVSWWLSSPEHRAGGGLIDHTRASRNQLADQLHQRVPGLSMAVIKDGRIEWEEGFGVADLTTRRRADARTIYPWFSMTKMVTATAVMQLVEHGQLHLDDSATDYLPEHTALFRPERYPAVTIRHLLGHSSGLANPIPPPARAR